MPRWMPRPPLAGRLAVLWLLPAVFALDQLTKQVVVRALPAQSPQPVLGDFLRFTFIHNRGAAFGLDLGGPVVHTAVAVAALGLLGWLYWTLPASARLQRSALAMVLGGALGNIADRVRLHQVVDFIDVGVSEAWRWPVFNVADSFVTVGVALLALGYSRQRDPRGERLAGSSPAAAADEPGSGG